MKKFYVITPKTYTPESLQISPVVSLDVKSLETIKKKYEVQEVEIIIKKSKVK